MYATGENAQLVQAQRELESLRAQLAKLGGFEDSSGGELLVPKAGFPRRASNTFRKLRDVNTTRQSSTSWRGSSSWPSSTRRRRARSFRSSIPLFARQAILPETRTDRDRRHLRGILFRGLFRTDAKQASDA